VTTVGNNDRLQKYEPLFEIHPISGASIEVFYADAKLATFGRGGIGWFWQVRQRGFAPQGTVSGPFPTSYSAYRNAMSALEPDRLFDGDPQSPASRVNTDTVRTRSFSG
jgi:hypothetical protein